MRTVHSSYSPAAQRQDNLLRHGLVCLTEGLVEGEAEADRGVQSAVLLGVVDLVEELAREARRERLFRKLITTQIAAK